MCLRLYYQAHTRLSELTAVCVIKPFVAVRIASHHVTCESIGNCMQIRAEKVVIADCGPFVCLEFCFVSLIVFPNASFGIPFQGLIDVAV